MRLKKILIGCCSLALISSPIIALIIINANPKEVYADSRFIIKDSHTDQAKLEIKKALDNTIGDGTLDLNFYTLTTTGQYTPSKLSWFEQLNKALKWIDPRINFNLIPRSNQTVESGFNQKNGEMISMFWSPDYHNVGTWISFWFYDDYVVPNLWPSLYERLKNADSSKKDELWDANLKNYLETKNLYKENEKPSYVSVNNFFQSYEDLVKIDLLNSKHNIRTSFRNDVGDQIAYWADSVSQKFAIDLVSWMDNQAAMIPWICDGPSSTKKLLVRENFHVPTNNYSDLTFRDWYYDGANAKDKNFKIWLATSPFTGNKTPYNPSFNDKSNSMFFQSTFNGLTDWKIINDWVLNDNGEWDAPSAFLTLGAASKIVMSSENGDVVHTIPSNGNKPSTTQDYTIYENTNKEEIMQKAKSTYQYTFTIESDRFPWMSTNGKTDYYLTANDFFWGLIGYLLSCDLVINTNDYYINLSSIDVIKTIKANPTFYDFYDQSLPENKKYSSWNLKPKINVDTKEIKFILKSPNINFLDILSKQYFQPLPIQNKLVQNIFKGPNSNDGLFYTINSSGKVVYDVAKSNFNKLYGAGSDYQNFANWWSSGAYYVTSATEQDIFFKMNSNYFDQFPNDMFTDNSKKIGSVTMKYGGSYSDQLTYTQFGTGEIDKSNIPIANISEASEKYKNSFRTEGIANISKTDIISFNTNVLERDNKKVGYLEWNSSYDEKRKALGNDGKTYVLKSLVSQNYYNAIVKDFSDPNGNSIKIRKGIINCVDWYSLASIAVPDDNPNFQQSVIPFGNFPIDPLVNNGSNTYYELAQKSINYGLPRRDIWTISDYEENWKKQF